jgi:hypothetical protein
MCVTCAIPSKFFYLVSESLVAKELINYSGLKKVLLVVANPNRILVPSGHCSKYFAHGE